MQISAAFHISVVVKDFRIVRVKADRAKAKNISLSLSLGMC